MRKARKSTCRKLRKWPLYLSQNKHPQHLLRGADGRHGKGHPRHSRSPRHRGQQAVRQTLLQILVLFLTCWRRRRRGPRGIVEENAVQELACQNLRRIGGLGAETVKNKL